MSVSDIYKILPKYNLNGRWNPETVGLTSQRSNYFINNKGKECLYYVFAWPEYEYHSEYFKLIPECPAQLSPWIWKRADNHVFWKECPSGSNSSFLEPLLLQSTHFPAKAGIKSCNQNIAEEGSQKPFSTFAHMPDDIHGLWAGKKKTFPTPHSFTAWNSVN